MFCSARDGTRTRTLLQGGGFKPPASAYSATRATFVTLKLGVTATQCDLWLAEGSGTHHKHGFASRTP